MLEFEKERVVGAQTFGKLLRGSLDMTQAEGNLLPASAP